jgi:hypothetical protein
MDRLFEEAELDTNTNTMIVVFDNKTIRILDTEEVSLGMIRLVKK